MELINKAIYFIHDFVFFLLIIIMVFGLYLNRFFMLSKGFKQIKKGKYKIAIEEFNKELEIKSKNWRLFYGLAYCYFMLGFSRNSLGFYKKVLALQPNKPNIYAEIAILYAELEKDFENTKQYLEKAISINKQNFILLRTSKYVFSEIYGRMYLLQNNWDKAQEYYKMTIPKYEKLLKKMRVKNIEKFTPLYFRLGSYYLNANKIDKAKKFFSLVIQISSESFFAERAQEELIKIEKAS